MDGLAPGPDGPAGREGAAPAGGEPAGADEAVEWDVVPEQSEDVVPEQSEEAASEESGAPAGQGVIRRRRLVAAAIVVLLVVIGVLAWRLTDTGGGGSPKLGGTPAEVVALVNGLQRALAGGDYQTICDSLFTTAAREAAGGDNCPSVLAQAGAKIASPTLSIRSVAVGGDQATVSVLAVAAGQRAATDELHLVRQGGRFRIASAGLLPSK